MSGVRISQRTLDNMPHLWYDCLMVNGLSPNRLRPAARGSVNWVQVLAIRPNTRNASVAYWLKPSAYNGVNGVQFPAEAPWERGGIGRHTRLKICRALPVGVQVPPLLLSHYITCVEIQV